MASADEYTIIDKTIKYALLFSLMLSALLTAFFMGRKLWRIYRVTKKLEQWIIAETEKEVAYVEQVIERHLKGVDKKYLCRSCKHAHKTSSLYIQKTKAPTALIQNALESKHIRHHITKLKKNALCVNCTMKFRNKKIWKAQLKKEEQQ